LRYVSLRYFNAAGASERNGEQHDPETHLVPILLDVAAERRRSVAIFGEDYPTEDGTCIRDYIHVVDLAQAHLLAIRGLERHGSQVYNLGSGGGYSVRQVIAVAREVTGHPIPTESVSRRSGDPAVLVASSDKIRRDLGWLPRRQDLRTILGDAWAWQHAHPRGYAN